MDGVAIAAAGIGILAGAGLTVLAAGLTGRLQRVPAPLLRDPASERRKDALGAGQRVSVLEHVLDLAGIGTYTWDLESDQLSWSSCSYRMFGQQPGSPVTYAMFRSLIHSEDLAAVEDALAASSRDRTDYQMRYRLVVGSDQVRYIQSSGRFVYGKEGNPTGLNGVVIDVTELTQMQLSKQHQEMELMVVAENLPDIISRFDGDGRFLFISKKIEELTGQPSSFYIGRRVDQSGFDYPFATRWNAVLDGVMRSKCEREFDFDFTDRHGADRFFIARAVPVLDASGRLLNILVISSDHTERERAAAQTRAISEALRVADRRKNEYLATLAHELRGPLAPISSAVQLIKLSSHRPAREKAREVIERQVASLSALINDLMEVGRISAGKIEIENKPLPLQRIMERASESVTPHLSLKRQQLDLRMPDDDMWIMGDELRLVQVFTNVLTNASKYSPPETTVKVEQLSVNGKAVVNICDQGIGLTESQMQDVFDIFVQVHSVGVQSQGGLGIGLSLVKQLVELHGGDVSVSSDGLDQGSCFTVTLPLTQARESSSQQGAPLSSAPTPLDILVVDDNVDGATTLATLLDAMGHRAVTAFTGHDAVRIAQSQQLDMAFIDLGLPDISGVQVALTIRATSTGRKLPLFALTGLGRDEDFFLTRSAQFNEHLVKPLSMDELLRITESVANTNRTVSSSN
ncbi:ATP-binding protein [Massilia sp.]|uniref:PAS domain-containing hybrid sensor histidine kinase/response regulator n=1 Tax=Massilia sp. TaxID=1882437 RepID=UPI0028B21A3A|nr:ATP-binding protein [Massilia sp.]